MRRGSFGFASSEAFDERGPPLCPACRNGTVLSTFSSFRLVRCSRSGKGPVRVRGLPERMLGRVHKTAGCVPLWVRRGQGGKAPQRCGAFLSLVVLSSDLRHSASPTSNRVSLGAVVGPLQRLEVGDFVPSAVCNRVDVVNLPPVLGAGVTVLAPFNGSTARVSAPHIRVVAADYGTLVPNGTLCRMIERSTGSRRSSITRHVYISRGCPSNVLSAGGPLCSPSIGLGGHAQ